MVSVTTRIVEAEPAKVWEVLADGWLYPLWVVGATRMREVDEDWPAPGAELHHSAGVWPLVIDDSTEVLEVTPGESLRLRARGWPAGEAEVVITLSARGEHTHVELREDAVSGPGRLLPAPLRSPVIGWRNTETLRRLAAIAEGR
jgi:uncharacterized protein YndB with AHSA1/START domain